MLQEQLSKYSNNLPIPGTKIESQANQLTSLGWPYLAIESGYRKPTYFLRMALLNN